MRCHERLIELGLTLPGFVERSKAIASLPSLGLLTLDGMTPSQHEVQHSEFNDFVDTPCYDRLKRHCRLTHDDCTSARREKFLDTYRERRWSA